jgi:23S rRNA pseudouridine1911/1915/1917 synthase
MSFMPTAKNNFTLIYEDHDFLVLDKPAGQIVNSATSHHQISLQDHFRALFGLPAYTAAPTTADSSPEEVFLERAGMVHRLDKNTSGLLIWAKNPLALHSLLAQFRLRQVAKTYTCLVHGLFSPSQETSHINLPLARKRTHRQLMAVDPTGRPALTHYRMITAYPHFDTSHLLTLHPPYSSREIDRLYQGFSLLQVTPKTGRTHQIRAHFTHHRHPLVGDTVYLPRRKAHLDPLWCPRQFLHAAQLSLTHPTTGQPLTFTAPLPPDLQSALGYLLTNIP